MLASNLKMFRHCAGPTHTSVGQVWPVSLQLAALPWSWLHGDHLSPFFQNRTLTVQHVTVITSLGSLPTNNLDPSRASVSRLI